MAMTAISAFAGVGGFDLGLARAGVSVTAAIEVDAKARGVLKRHFPATSLLSDIREITGEQLLSTGFNPASGILAGGWPCQGHSVAGLRHGLDDDRSGLFDHLVRLAQELHPRWLFFENVPGLLSSRAGQDMGRVLRQLVEIGYGVSWRVLDAQRFGVPQRRRRVLLVGHLGDFRGPEQVLLECESGLRHLEAGRAAGPQATAAPAAGAESRGRAYGLSAATPDVAGPLGANQGGHRCDLDGSGAYVTSVLGDITHTLTAEGHDASEDGTGRGIPVVAYDLAQVTSPENRANPRPGDPAPPLCATGRPSIAYPVALRGRDGGTQIETGPAEGPAYALRAASGGASAAMVVTNTLTANYGSRIDSTASSPLVTEELAVRRLTPRECERLQGFPDDWTLYSGDRQQADSARYRQMGNAVPVPMILWGARRIVAIEAARTASAG
ncbi:DNA cytosine methyltransferase [Nonomuraea sp. NPDC049646]|uniref:DNA cytosine methyltransferase n=1 Tax=unclassified Nonomuraea TaxID=2593643 RepID=UPI00379E0BDF